MRKITLLFFLCTFVPLSVSAQSIFSCEAKRIAGNNQTLEVTEYKSIFPTIIIDYEKNTLFYVYYDHDRKWEQKFNILKRDKNNIAGIYKLQANWITTIHFNLEQKDFTISYSGNYGDASGNTTTFGKCSN